MQNINLFQPEIKRSQGPRPRQMLIGWGVLFVVLLLHAGWQFWQLQRVTGLAAAAQVRAQGVQVQFEAAKAGFREPQLDAHLPEQLAQLEAANVQLQRLLSHLQLLTQQQSAGFVAPLTALSERHPPAGLWLNAISLADGGSNLSLQGVTTDQELLPQYLHSLGVSPVFHGRDFAQFDLQRGSDGLLSFHLASRLGDGGKKP